MTKISFTDTYNGLTAQAPVRKYPGQVEDILNLRLALDKGATTRNGTDLIRYLTEIPTELNIEDVLIVPFRGDIILFYDNNILAFNATTGEPVFVDDETGGFPYLSGAVRKDLRFAVYRNSIIVANRNTTVEATNTPNYVVNDTVDRFSDLPDPAAIGMIVRCRYNDGAIRKGYYRRYDTGGGVLGWEILPAPNQTNARLVSTTMPHQLIRNSDGTYQWDEITWTDRESGDDQENPAPPFVNQTIDTIAFHKGRLFLISKNSIVSTSSFDKFNFYIRDIDNASDVQNPISHDIGNSQVSTPIFSHSTGKELFIACEKGQLIFTAGEEQLTNVNGDDVSLSDYKTDPTAFPAFAGSTAVVIDSFGTVHEFGPTEQGFLSDLGTLNSNVLKLFHGRTIYQVRRFGTTTWFITDDKTYVHEKALEQGELVQSGWTIFNFNPISGGTNQLFFMEEEAGVISLLIKNDSTGFFLASYIHGEEKPKASYTDPYGEETLFFLAPVLDNRLIVPGVWDQARDVTRFEYPNGGNFTRVFTYGTQPLTLTPSRVTSGYVEVRGNHEGGGTYACIVGNLVYSFMDLTDVYLGASTARPTISSITIFTQNTLQYDVLLRRRSQGIADQVEYQYKTQYLLNQVITSSVPLFDVHTFNVMLDGRNEFCRIESHSPVPMTISALEFDVRITDKGATR